MTVKQISVFLENKPGQLAEFTKLLESQQINMCALSLADAEDFGILRIIVDDSYKTACVLKEAGYVFSITPVLAVEIPDKPGSLVRVLDVLGENGVNLEYTYAFTVSRSKSAYMIFRVADTDRAIAVLDQNNIHLVCQGELSGLLD
nr:ACT domain-containing protein [Maliibacterium massiliense]